MIFLCEAQKQSNCLCLDEDSLALIENPISNKKNKANMGNTIQCYKKLIIDNKPPEYIPITLQEILETKGLKKEPRLIEEKTVLWQIHSTEILNNDLSKSKA